MIKEILLWPDKRLTLKSSEVEVGEDITELIVNLKDTMQAFKAEGIAAPQLGVNKRVFLIRDTEGGIIVAVNPEILISQEVGDLKAHEGCLSFPGVGVQVTRKSTVTLSALDEKGRAVIHSLQGMPAVAAQHELDHLDGVVMIDHLESTLARRASLKRLKKMKKKYGL